MAASRAALEHGAADDAAIMQFIAGFMCGRSSVGSASDGPTAALAGSQRSSDGISSRADDQDEVAAVADVLHRLSAHESARHRPPGQHSPDHPAAPNGSGGHASADMIASGQFDWAGGLPQEELPAQRSSVISGAADRQAASPERLRLPAGGSAEAAQAMLSGQFQWGGGTSTPQPLPAAPTEAVIL